MQVEPLVGIPGSISDQARRIQWSRQPDLQLPTGNVARVYDALVADGSLRAIVSHDETELGRPRWHVSVSHQDAVGTPDRCPNWDELKHAAYRLIQSDVPLMLIFPRRSAPYVNVHDTTLHLWECQKDVDL